MMVESMTFDIPTLEKEEVMECFRSGLLGDIARDILPEHLDNPTPAVMMQLCLSILEKHSIDAASVSSAFLNCSLDMKHPEIYFSTYKLINVSVLIKKLIPTLGKQLVMSDLTSPRPKKLLKFICCCINYFKSWDNNAKVFEDIYSGHEVERIQNRELIEKSENQKKSNAEIKQWLQEQKSRAQELQVKTEKMVKEEQLCLKRKEEKELLKGETKKKFQEAAATLEKNQKALAALIEEKDRLLNQIVASPKRHLDKKNRLMQALQVLEDQMVGLQGDIRETELLISVMEPMKQPLENAMQTIQDNSEIHENIKKMKEEEQSISYEIKVLRLAAVEEEQNVTNIKQQFVSLQEKISRMALRWKQNKAEFTRIKSESENEKKVLESKAGQIHEGVLKMEEEIKYLEQKQLHKEQEFELFKTKIEETKEEVMIGMDSYMTKVQKQLSESPAAKIVKSRKKIHSNAQTQEIV